MRGSVSYQVKQLFEKSGINCIGESRHAAKTAARVAGSSSPQAIADKLGIHSYSTADSYRATWRQVLQFAKDEYNVRDAEKLEGMHLRAWLETRIEDNVAHATYMSYAAACGKLEVALNGYAASTGNEKRYDFKEKIRATREEAHDELKRFTGSRAYTDPAGLIGAITNGNHRLAASVQVESGARIHETAVIRATQLRSINTEPVTGQQRGVVEIKGKGGKVRMLYVKPETYRELEQYIKQQGDFRIDKDAYRMTLKEAAITTRQNYTGSHGLRWSYARERYQEVMQRGYTAEQSLLSLSWSMGHDRLDDAVTIHYLS